MNSHRRYFVPLVVGALIVAAEGRAGAQKPAAKQRKQASPVFAPVKDDPALPRVLLIGDSISIGYTLPVRAALAGKANVHRIPTNGGPTTRGLEKIDNWLGEGRWDVIHFNWGLHDLKSVNGRNQVPLDKYEENLQKLVQRLKKTNARLIWCSTTPVPAGVNPPRTNDDVLAYNAAAKRIMEQEGVAINDLYAFAAPRLEDIQLPKNVHFSPPGSKALAEQVSAAISAALNK